jgi:hypothetical protein
MPASPAACPQRLRLGKPAPELLDAFRAGDWAAVRDYKVSGSNSYSKLVARYRQDLLAVHAASEGAP